jgi:ubiquinone/menaquinone biosynthesis C-methylase UbiE
VGDEPVDEDAECPTDARDAAVPSWTVGEASMDKWASWLLHRRDGDDPEQRVKALEHLIPVRNRVLENARLRPGEVLLDVGAGDGLIAFAALDLVGAEGRVIASDISSDLVGVARQIAIETHADDRMSFVVADAEDLRPIADESVDVVTTRSVLIYVADKETAFRAFYGVLRPGGRVSSFEPINNYFPDDPSEFWGVDATPVRDLVEKVWLAEGWSEESKRNDPMINFSEKDLVAIAEEAGFGEVHAKLDVDVGPGSWAVDWDRLMGTSPNPNARTVGESIAAALTPSEATRLQHHLRPLVDEGRGIRRTAAAYLVAIKT